MNDLIICRKCKLSKPKTEFFKASKKVSSKYKDENYVDKICKSCKHSNLQNLRRLFKQWCVDYKGGKCTICSYNKSLAALEFHHLNPNEKEFLLTRKGLISRKKAIIELDKCILVCSNCHRELHYGN